MLRDMIGNDAGGAAAANREDLARLAHSLSGAGGTFGFAELSDTASRLENLLAVGPEVSNEVPNGELQAAANELVEELERVAKG